VLISAAAGVAQTVGASRVVIAAHAGDHPIYPDCRPDFLSMLSAALHVGYGVSVGAPFLGWTKTEIAVRAAALGVPVGRTWSCYAGGTVHCGRCGTCVERREALVAAGADPTTYADPDFWLSAVTR
jgi:7-cyano-7-deazaguanine synthase